MPGEDKEDDDRDEDLDEVPDEHGDVGGDRILDHLRVGGEAAGHVAGPSLVKEANLLGHNGVENRPPETGDDTLAGQGEEPGPDEGEDGGHGEEDEEEHDGVVERLLRGPVNDDVDPVKLREVKEAPRVLGVTGDGGGALALDQGIHQDAHNEGEGGLGEGGDKQGHHGHRDDLGLRLGEGQDPPNAGLALPLGLVQPGLRRLVLLRDLDNGSVLESVEGLTERGCLVGLDEGEGNLGALQKRKEKKERKKEVTFAVAKKWKP